MNVYLFNSGYSAIYMDYCNANQSWLVWRADGGHNAPTGGTTWGVRMFNDKIDARADYDDRVAFLESIRQIKLAS